MTNMQTPEDVLAEIDLRVLLELYASHPTPIDVPVEDVATRPAFVADRYMALARMQRLHDRGLISGTVGADELVYGSLMPPTANRMAQIIHNQFDATQKVTWAERAKSVIEACDAGDRQAGQCTQIRDGICDWP